MFGRALAVEGNGVHRHYGSVVLVGRLLLGILVRGEFTGLWGGWPRDEMFPLFERLSYCVVL